MATFPGGSCKGHVLAVDDCAATRELIRISLERVGYRVRAVDSGWAALQAVANDTFDAIVLDVEMPGLDGMALGNTLRRDPRTAAAMITMHTSVDEALVRRGFSHYDAFVPKSGNPMLLGEWVDRLLCARRTTTL